jgi:hypothetical protein
MLILYRSTWIPTATEQLPCQSVAQNADSIVFIDVAASFRQSRQREPWATGKPLQV